MLSQIFELSRELPLKVTRWLLDEIKRKKYEEMTKGERAQNGSTKT